MEKSALAGEGGGGGVHAYPHSPYFPSRTKLQCTLYLRGRYDRYITILFSSNIFVAARHANNLAYFSIGQHIIFEGFVQLKS